MDAHLVVQPIRVPTGIDERLELMGAEILVEVESDLPEHLGDVSVSRCGRLE